MDVLNLLLKKNGPGVGTRIQVPLPFEQQFGRSKEDIQIEGLGALNPQRNLP